MNTTFKSKRFLVLPLLALAACGMCKPSHAADALQDAFECRAISGKIDGALQARTVRTDGKTQTHLAPPIMFFGFPVTDVTVFREGGEDIYTSYINAPVSDVALADGQITAKQNSFYKSHDNSHGVALTFQRGTKAGHMTIDRAPDNMTTRVRCVIGTESED